MIITLNDKASEESFLQLLSRSDRITKKKAADKPSVFVRMDPIRFEEELFSSFKEAAEGTAFEGSIDLVSGQKFPDIVIQKNYGVEVKTTTQDQWTSTGNSIMETTRVSSVERIFLYFAKLSDNLDFKYKRYQDCLSDIVVTHSPRYKIDMNLKAGDTVFEKMGIEYDELRKLANPVAPYQSYMRKNMPKGRELWWMGDDTAVPSTVQLFNTLSVADKKRITIESMVLFPSVFGNDQQKFSQVALWLAGRHGVVNPSLRDTFTAGGLSSIVLGGFKYQDVPRILKNLNDIIFELADVIRLYDDEELLHRWGVLKYHNPIHQWMEIFIYESFKSFKEERIQRFVVHLCSILNENLFKPDFLNSLEKRFALA